MRIKIEIPSKFYLLLNIEIERKINLTKRKKIRIKIEIKNTTKILFMGEIEKKIKFNKKPKKKK